MSAITHSGLTKVPGDSEGDPYAGRVSPLYGAWKLPTGVLSSEPDAAAVIRSAKRVTRLGTSAYCDERVRAQREGVSVPRRAGERRGLWGEAWEHG